MVCVVVGNERSANEKRICDGTTSEGMNKIISSGLQLNLFLNLDHSTTRCYARSAEGVRQHARG